MRLPRIDLSALCPNGTFVIVDPETETLGECFVDSALLLPVYTLFSIVNAYVLGKARDQPRKHAHFLVSLFRCLASLALALALSCVFLKYFLTRDPSEPRVFTDGTAALPILTDVTQLLGLALHSLVIFNKSVFSFYPVKLVWSLLALASVNALATFNYAYPIWPGFQGLSFDKKAYGVATIAMNALLFFYVFLVLLSYSKCCFIPGVFSRRPARPLLVNEDQANADEDELDDEETRVLIVNDRVIADSEEDQASYWSYLTFGWLAPVMKRGFRRQITSIQQLSRLPFDLNLGQLCGRFMEFYQPRSAQSKTTPYNDPIINPEVLLDPGFVQEQTVSYEDDLLISRAARRGGGGGGGSDSSKNLTKSLLKCFGARFFLLGVLKLANDLLNFAGPLLLNQLVQFVDNSNASLKTGCLFASGLLVSTLVSSLLNIHFTNSMNKLCLAIRGALISLIYRKSITVKLSELRKYSVGQVVNYMSVDSDSVVNAFPSFHMFWSLPVQIAITLYLLYSQIGISFLVGVFFVLILIPINKFMSDYIGRVQERLMRFKDQRVKILTEFLHGIRIIKFYSWENYFLGRIEAVREKEISQLRAKKYLDAGCVYFWACTPILMSVFTFITYVLLGNELTPAKVFTSLALFNMLISPLNAFPWVINGLVQAWVSLKRLQEFLSLNNLSWFSYYSLNELHGYRENTCLEIRNGHFQWKADATDQFEAFSAAAAETESLPDVDHVLKQINFQLNYGKLIGVIGKVGCGKTSFLHTLMGEIEKTNGKVRIDPFLCSNGFAYVGQECWIQGTTIRENILFGAPFDAALYKRVLDVCALDADLELLPRGDMTPVGENGITLSGGQKARLSLARACYACNTKDIYLLDDPLSAVDAHVAKHIYEKCICDFLASKTRVLCTHHIKYLTNTDLVLVIDSGRIVTSGKGSELVDDYLKSVHFSGGRSQRTTSTSSSMNNETDECVSPKPETTDDAVAADVVREELLKMDDSAVGRQDEEEKEQGAISSTVLKHYCRAVGVALTLLTLLALTLMQTSRNLTDFWLSHWTQRHQGSVNLSTRLLGNATFLRVHVLNTHQTHFYSPAGFMDNSNNRSDSDSQFFFIVYGALCLANTVFTLFRAFLFAFSGISAGRYIHRSLVQSLSKAKIKFFDVTPRGRILNRLSSDVYCIDDSLPFILNIFLANLFGLVGILVVTCYSLPWFSLSLIPLSVIYFTIQNYYRWTSRELKRLSSVTLSPIYTHFNETLAGLATIRAFRQGRRFLKQNELFLTNYIRASYVNSAAGQWLSFRLQMMSVAMVTVVGFTAVFQHVFSTANASLIGLALSYILSVTGLLNGLITTFTETEKEMVSVERTHQFERLESENWRGVTLVSPRWPEYPTIDFSSVVLRYEENGPSALNDISFSINAGEKIGICGRTGSGKSSLFAALFRATELHAGTIKIDGVNIRNLDLKTLREAMSIIPQDPFLFSGTLRENLDPLGGRNDAELWRALARCRLEAKFRSAPGGLGFEIDERGSNLSSGEKQLVCLARAILSAKKILCIDEATASVDFETDNFIQQTIRDEFKDVTVLTIAHRINTIFDYDRVLVMSGGRVGEFGSVKSLLLNKQSLFYGLVSEQQSRKSRRSVTK